MERLAKTERIGWRIHELPVKSASDNVLRRESDGDSKSHRNCHCFSLAFWNANAGFAGAARANEYGRGPGFDGGWPELENVSPRPDADRPTH